MIKKKKKDKIGNSLVVQWLGLCAFALKGPGSMLSLSRAQVQFLVGELRLYKPCGTAKKTHDKI